MIAQHQNIVYNEYLPTLFDQEILKRHHLVLEKESVYFDLVSISPINHILFQKLCTLTVFI